MGPALAPPAELHQAAQLKGPLPQPRRDGRQARWKGPRSEVSRLADWKGDTPAGPAPAAEAPLSTMRQFAARDRKLRQPGHASCRRVAKHRRFRQREYEVRPPDLTPQRARLAPSAWRP